MHHINPADNHAGILFSRSLKLESFRFKLLYELVHLVFLYGNALPFHLDTMARPGKPLQAAHQIQPLILKAYDKPVVLHRKGCEACKYVVLKLSPDFGKRIA